MAANKIVKPAENELKPFIHQRQIISAPFAFPEVSYFELCGGYGPLDCDTEFLSQTGWKRIADYAPGDKVLQYNMENNTSEFVNPEAYYKLPAKELYSVKTKMALDWTMAEEHRQPIWRKRKGKWAFDRVYTAGELLTEHSSSTKVATSWKGLKGAGEWKYTEWETRLLIAVSADGRFDTKYTTHCRMKLKKERKIERLKMLLDKCGIEYKTGTDTDGCALFFFYTPARVKEYGQEWYNCPSDIFCDEVLRWDGTAKEQEYYTNSKNNADMVQFHFSNAGYRATINQNKSKLPLTLYTVHYSTATFIGFIQDGQKPEKIKAPDGYKYCFTVPSSFIVVRKNNKIFITGNCGKSFSIVYIIITLTKRYQGQDITIALCSTTITLLNKTVILDLQKLFKKTGSHFLYNQKDNILTIGTVRFLLIATGQPTDIYGPNVHITLCLDGNTKVLVKDNDRTVYKRLKHIIAGDTVLTREGWHKVIKAKKQGVKKVICKCGLIGTPNHKIPTPQGKTINLEQLYDYSIYVCSKWRVRQWEQLKKVLKNANQKLLTLMVYGITDTRKAECAVNALTFGVQAISHYTRLYGKKQTVKCRTVLSYIIKTKILLTILLKILSVFQEQNTHTCTVLKRIVVFMQKQKLRLYVMYAESILKELKVADYTLLAHLNVQPLQNDVLQGISAALSTCRKYKQESQHDMKLLVQNVEMFLHQSKILLSSALKNVEMRIHGNSEQPQYKNGSQLQSNVPVVEKTFKLKTKLLDSVHQLALTITGGKRTVYDISVEGCHEFMTSKGLVHNCDEVDELPEMKAIEAHKALSERTRLTLPAGRKPFIMYFSTVHGYRGLYKIVQELKSNNLPNVLVRGLTKNNTSLDPQYVKNLYAIYDEQERLAYLEGRFVNLQSGRVYGNYDEETCKCKPFEITPDMTIYVGQDLNSGFSKATAVVKKDKTLYIIHGWSFKEVGGAPALMRAAFPKNEILWFPDCSGKEILKGYKQEIFDNGIQCRIGSSNPRILDTVFYVNKLFKLGKLKIFDCKATNDVSEALKVQAYNDMGQPEKGKGENDPDHYTDSVRYVIYRIVRSDPDFMDLKELSRENVKEHGYLQIAGQSA